MSDEFDPQYQIKKPTSTGWLIVKIILYMIGGSFLLLLLLIGLVLFMCSRH